jgi:hypothetical protein
MRVRFMSGFIKKILSREGIILLLPVVALVISLPFLSLGWMFDDSFFRFQMRNTVAVKEYLPEEFAYNPVRGFYSFVDKNPERTYFLKDRGLISWWGNDKTAIAFWRPLTSTLLALDLTLWPEQPLFLHIHNSIWFMALACAAILVLRKIIYPSWIAGIAGVVFVINSINLLPVAWISNRHALTAITLGMISFLFYIMSHREKKRRNLIVSSIFFVFSLLASEIGIITIGYLCAYTLFLSDNPLKKRIYQFIPFLIILVVWRVFYTIQGFGVYASQGYIDPLNSPLEFFSSMRLKIPFLCSSVLLNIPSDLFSYFSRDALPVTAFILFIIPCFIMFLARRSMGKEKSFFFWVCSFLFTMVPLCTSIPVDRNLIPLSFCTAGLIASLFSCGRQSSAQERKKKYSFPVIFFWVFVGLKIAGCIAGLFFYHSVITHLGESFHKQMDFGDDPSLAYQDVIIIAPPTIHFNYAFSIARLVEGIPMPRHIRVLSPFSSDILLTRLSNTSIRITAEDGYYQPPRCYGNKKKVVSCYFNPAYSQKRMEQMLIDSSYTPVPGDTIRLSNILIQISGLTEDGRIKEVVFHFNSSLEDPRFRFITWDRENQMYVPFSLPGKGETRQVKGIR